MRFSVIRNARLSWDRSSTAGFVRVLSPQGQSDEIVWPARRARAQKTASKLQESIGDPPLWGSRIVN
jgi:hypothetical protein